MNKWIEAAWFDLTGQESKQRLTRQEKMNYSVYAAGVFGALTVASLFVPSPWGVIVVLVCGGISLRKLFIYWNKSKQLEKENEILRKDE